MKEFILDCKVEENISLNPSYGLLKLSIPIAEIIDIESGQFVQVRIDDSKDTFLRRPISICRYDKANNQIWLLIRNAGEGTSHLLRTAKGTNLNIILPLGKGFSIPANKDEKLLLIGGGVGVAPLLCFGELLKDNGYNPSFLLGAKTDKDILLLDEFKSLGEVYISTDDGSKGEKGFIIQNSILTKMKFDKIYTCGPLVMMKGIAEYAKKNGIECEVSLENLMACGLGACLCCVEDTKDNGNVCVCKEGPVFNITKLKW